MFISNTCQSKKVTDLSDIKISCIEHFYSKRKWFCKWVRYTLFIQWAMF